MPDAQFEVEVRPRSDGCGPRGADKRRVLDRPQRRFALGPVARDRLGGELSRVMPALLSVAHGQPAKDDESPPLLVFDEIDAGIGGHTARVVGEHLRELSR